MGLDQGGNSTAGNRSGLRRFLKLLDALMQQLERPLSNEELANGWTEGAKTNYLEMLRNLKAGLESGKIDLQTLGRMNLPRSMDHWGIIGGRILDMAASMEVALREVLDKEK